MFKEDVYQQKIPVSHCFEMHKKNNTQARTTLALGSMENLEH